MESIKNLIPSFTASQYMIWSTVSPMMNHHPADEEEEEGMEEDGGGGEQRFLSTES
jgi:hypothetical protein